MQEHDIRLIIDGEGIAKLTLNRPTLHNAFDDHLIAGLTARLRELEATPDVRVIILAANGKSFSAGADLNWMKRMAGYSEPENLRDAVALADLMHTLKDHSKPTIARVQGPAYGGGVGLIACCDIAVATRTSQFALTEVRLGLLPAVISPYVVSAIGERMARRYFLTAERIDAMEALRIGLVHAVVDNDEELDRTVATLAAELIKGGPRALAATKNLITTVSRGPVDRRMIEDTAGRIARLRVSTEGREGIAAFLDKRPPDWQKPSNRTIRFRCSTRSS